MIVADTKLLSVDRFQVDTLCAARNALTTHGGCVVSLVRELESESESVDKTLWIPDEMANIQEKHRSRWLA